MDDMKEMLQEIAREKAESGHKKFMDEVNAVHRLERTKDKAKETVKNNAWSMGFTSIPMTTLTFFAFQQDAPIAPWCLALLMLSLGFVAGIAACWMVIKNL